ncbi:Mitochondrial carrier family protein [Babesia bovis T2Bo]|uniref:Mitochondrial carrier protein, putative n=1 Tax=Babesia bovis TaxID=5865 RepID=A7AUI1_BABBO|nr:Mitochondrial carrier family protein [Babesia bovis T2Bo]EDO06592.1 Mitochondrial carrier family protein [Babesia bovis T2Bo]|eukprot:XP_001610160.1 Mitochondrial carrier protein [Babesia bovis T2Bo]
MESDDATPLNFDEWNGDCTLWQHAICGSAAGVMEHTLLFPLDTLKTRLQCGWCNQERKTIASVLERGFGACSLSPPQTRIYGQLYRGCNIMAVGCIPAHVLYFTAYEVLKKVVNVPMAGAIATVCHDAILTPADVIKQRLQVGSYRNSFHCVAQIMRYEGIKSFYRSLPVALFMNMPYNAVLVGINDFLLNRHPGGANNRSIRTYFLYAGIGGAVAGAITNPIDVIKTHMQTQQCYRKDKDPSRPVYTNPANTALALYREYGFRIFWRGTVTRMCICLPAAAISWGTYSTLKNAFRNFNNG